VSANSVYYNRKKYMIREGSLYYDISSFLVVNVKILYFHISFDSFVSY